MYLCHNVFIYFSKTIDFSVLVPQKLSVESSINDNVYEKRVSIMLPIQRAQSLWIPTLIISKLDNIIFTLQGIFYKFKKKITIWEDFDSYDVLCIYFISKKSNVFEIPFFDKWLLVDTPPGQWIREEETNQDVSFFFTYWQATDRQI